MKKKQIIWSYMTVFAILLAGSLLFFKYQNQKSQTILNLTSKEKRSDFDTLCYILDENYPFWREIAEAGIDKDDIYSIYRDNIEKTKTDIAYFKEINYFLKEFQGFGHLGVLDGYTYRLYEDTLNASGDLLSEEETQSVEPLIAVLTNSTSKNTYAHLDQSHEGFRSTIGLKKEYQYAEAADSMEKESNLTMSVLDDKKVAYLKIQSFELTNYQKDQTVLNNFFAEINDISNLIIDLRGNSGGSDLYWEDLLVKPNVKERLTSGRYYLFNLNETTNEYVSANGLIAENINATQDPFLSEYANIFSHYIKDVTSYEAAANPYRGNIWILVDEKVYSSSENFAYFCKNTGFATLVGTTTGGDGGIADPMLFSLPNSGLIVRFSIFYGLNADGSGNEAYGTIPDVVITENEDALDKCLSLLD